MTLHRKVLTLIAGVFFLTSLVSPAVSYSHQYQQSFKVFLPGWDLFVQGLLLSIMGIITLDFGAIWRCLPWFGNLLFVVATVHFMRGLDRRATVFSFLAAVCMLFYAIEPSAFPTERVGGGLAEEAVQVQRGYFFWLSAPAVVFVASVTLLISKAGDRRP
ncbi:hypothetical protein [Allohahella sp. A8]|uniref:hypothetical protein n=1 Tax=Allohahella sp. A8 TaxID=3141461 RepID=UPI003A8066D7